MLMLQQEHYAQHLTILMLNIVFDKFNYIGAHSGKL